MANSTATFAVQGAVIQLLQATPALTSLAPVFDEVPEGHDYPYIELDRIEEQLDNRFAKNGRTLLVQFSIYSNQPGNLEVEHIVEQMNILLDDNLIPSPTGWSIFQNLYELGTLDKEFDTELLRHFIAQYRVNCEAAP